MFRFASKFNEETIFYFDIWGNKHVATGGTLPWRLRNPGLIHKRTQAAFKNGSIGSYADFAIFAEPEHGFKALADWLSSKTCQNMTLQGLAKHYRQKDNKNFLDYLIRVLGVPSTRKVGALSQTEFQNLQHTICKLCGYTCIGDEHFALLPKISAKIENGVTNQEFYLILDNIVLSKQEAVEWVLSHRLDAVIVHDKNDDKHIHLRSRPYHCMQHIRLNERNFNLLEGQFETIYRSVGQKKPGQCIWAFINGIANTREEALASAALISEAAAGEMVLSMPNDQIICGIGNAIAAFIKKVGIDTPVVELAVKFFRHLIKLSDDEAKHPPIIVFVHSQGAIIAEHALEHLKPVEWKRLKIFTFGGGSFISSNKCHPDSDNYASAGDLIPKGGSPNHQNLALSLYYGAQKGESQETVIDKLALRDAILCFNAMEYSFTGTEKFEIWVQKRKAYYREELQKLEVTVLDPGSKFEHAFKNDCYQNAMKSIIGKYQNHQSND